MAYWTHAEDEVTTIMADERGKHFDPRLFDCFLELEPTFQSIRRQVEREGSPFWLGLCKILYCSDEIIH